jgi:VanZ family protein
VQTFAWQSWLARAAISTTLVASVIWGTLVEPSTLGFLKVPDKLQHFLAYLGLSAWFSGITSGARRIGVALFLVGMGASLEVLQSAMGLGRMADYKDFIANVAGVIIGTWLGRYAFNSFNKPSNS